MLSCKHWSYFPFSQDRQLLLLGTLPNTAVKSGSGYERAMQEHILLLAPYNNKYMIFSDHNSFSTRENAKSSIRSIYKQYWPFLQIFFFRLSGERTMYMHHDHNEQSLQNYTNSQFIDNIIRFILYI